MTTKIFKTCSYNGWYNIQNSIVYYYTDYTFSFVSTNLIWLEECRKDEWDLWFFSEMSIEDFIKLDGLKLYTIDEWIEFNYLEIWNNFVDDINLLKSQGLLEIEDIFVKNKPFPYIDLKEYIYKFENKLLTLYMIP